MKNDFYKILVASAACLMLSASAPAQSESQDSPPMAPPMPVQADRGWSTKHLSATGRDSDGAVRATKLVGAQVNDISGHRVGQIQDIIVNPVSGRIDFALPVLLKQRQTLAQPTANCCLCHGRFFGRLLHRRNTAPALASPRLP